MALFTMRLASILRSRVFATQEILAVCDRFKMRWVYAGGNLAEMVEH